MHYPKHVCTFGIRLHPARAGTVLGVAAPALVNIVSPLDRVCKELDDRLATVIDAHPRMESADARNGLERVLVDNLCSVTSTDDVIVRAVDRLLGADILVRSPISRRNSACLLDICTVGFSTNWAC